MSKVKAKSALRWTWRVVVFVGALLALGVVGALVIDGTVTSAEGAVLAILGLVAAVLLALGPNGVARLGDRVTTLTVGPVAIGMLIDADRAVSSARRVVGELADESDDPVDTSTHLIDLRLKLERKLTYIAKHMLGSRRSTATYLTVGSLQYDGYLTVEQARTATRILTVSESDFATLDAAQQRRFLRDANELANSVRALVLYGQLTREVKKRGWCLSKIDRGSRRADLLVEKGGKRYRVASVFALPAASKRPRNAVERMEKSLRKGPPVDAGLIVIPRLSGVGESHVDANPRIVTIATFKKLLREPG